jgi:hypothetical protein
MHGNEPKAIGVKDLEAVDPDLLNVQGGGKRRFGGIDLAALTRYWPK